MLSIFTKTVSYLWKQVGGSSESQVELYESEDSDIEKEDNGAAESKELHGIITNVNECNRFGLINEDVYFSFDVVNGSTNPCVGDKVLASIHRLREGDSWKAIQVCVVDEYWDEADTGNSVQRTDLDISKFNVGIISSISNDILTLKDGDSICLKDVVLNDFNPQVGDVIQFSLDTKELKPSRIREVDGEITRTKPDKTGTINNEIWFDFSACLNNFYPKRGTMVVATAVESVREFYMWRATRVVPKELPRPPKVNNHLLSKSPVQQNFLQSLLSNKNGVTVSSPLDFGIMMQGSKGYITVHIKNAGEDEQVLSQCRIQRKESVFTLGSVELFDVEMTGSDCSVALLPGTSAYVNIYCNATDLGCHKEMLLFEFKGFEIGCYISVQINNALQNVLVQKNGFYKQNCNQNRNPPAWQRDDFILPGEKPFRTRHYLPVSLPMFTVPEKLKLAVVNRGDIVTVAPSLGQEMSAENYAERFASLLHLEEIQMQLSMRQFDMHDVCLTPMGSELLSLYVPGLAEGRPSLLIGDKVYLLSPDGTPGPIYQGYIHEVLMDQVLIKFHVSFHTKYSGESYDVEFEFSRTNMRRSQNAVKQAHTLVLPEVLFPNSVTVQHPKFHVRGKLELSNKQLNSRQRSAVRRILEHQCRPLPYIIFGPPGTGKTVTLVEAALQVFKNIKSSRLIICAPTNSAADLITIRLHGSGLLGLSDLARLNAFQRNQDSVPDCIKRYCFYGDEDINKLIYYRIIVSTLGTIGVVYGLKLATGHFTHFFMDEAGQATEPETLVGMELVTSAGAHGQVILAGDPKQLGPVLLSSYSSFYGLQTSFLERLMAKHLYCRDTARFADHGNYDPLLVTKLVENYRSHSALLKVYSDLFYNSELIPMASNLTPVQWNSLNNVDFPLLFHGIKGEEIQESDSPSWFNPGEVVQVVTYLQELYSLDICPDEVGIITPYRKQVEKVKLLCGTLGVEICKIGSVEEFQGQEKRVILLSLVRCSKCDLSSLNYNHLGFIGQPKRFNVAISRAQSLLILIGDPDLLAQDENWRTLLRYCVDNEAYVGCPVD